MVFIKKIKSIKIFLIVILCSLNYVVVLGNNSHVFFPLSKQNDDIFKTSVTFPAGYASGDYIEFVGVRPSEAGASGYYNVSISYTKMNLAAGATHLAAISHFNPSVWRELGRVNANGYTNESYAVTVDCNTDMLDPRFRVRVIDLLGDANLPLTVNIKVESISHNAVYLPINRTGKDLIPKKLQPMTGSWDLYVGNPYTSETANIAIKALMNGNVGIGTAFPKEKLSVNGNIRAKEVKVERDNWPDYVFEETHEKPSLEYLDNYVRKYKHLPEVPTAKEVSANGIELGQLGATLLKKIEELTLYMIELKKDNVRLGEEVERLKLSK